MVTAAVLEKQAKNARLSAISHAFLPVSALHRLLPPGNVSQYSAKMLNAVTLLPARDLVSFLLQTSIHEVRISLIRLGGSCRIDDPS